MDFQFTDVEFMSAKEKELVLRQWKRFIKALLTCDFNSQTGADYGYFPTALDKAFPDRLYKHLSLHCGFIAHYNRRGFLSARFGSLDCLAETFDQLRRAFVSGDYRDIWKAMVAELEPWQTAILAQASK